MRQMEDNFKVNVLCNICWFAMNFHFAKIKNNFNSCLSVKFAILFMLFEHLIYPPQIPRQIQRNASGKKYSENK